MTQNAQTPLHCAQGVEWSGVDGSSDQGCLTTRKARVVSLRPRQRRPLAYRAPSRRKGAAQQSSSSREAQVVVYIYYNYH